MPAGKVITHWNEVINGTSVRIPVRLVTVDGSNEFLVEIELFNGSISLRHRNTDINQLRKRVREDLIKQTQLTWAYYLYVELTQDSSTSAVISDAQSDLWLSDPVQGKELRSFGESDLASSDLTLSCEVVALATSASGEQVHAYVRDDGTRGTHRKGWPPTGYDESVGCRQFLLPGTRENLTVVRQLLRNVNELHNELLRILSDESLIRQFADSEPVPCRLEPSRKRRKKEQ